MAPESQSEPPPVIESIDSTGDATSEPSGSTHGSGLRQPINAVMVGLAVFVLAAAGAWFALVAQAPEKLSAGPVHSEWGAVDASHSQLVSRVTFNNYLKTSARLAEVHYGITLNGVALGTGLLEPALQLEGGQSTTLALELTFDTAAMTAWWNQHVANEESSRVRVGGEAVFQVGPDTVRVSFGSETEWKSSLRDRVSEMAKNCPQPGPSLCVQATKAAWIGSEDQRVLLVGLELQNPGPNPVAVSTAGGALLLNGVPVMTQNLPSRLTVPADATARLEFSLRLEPNALAAWWPLHVAACESSTAALRVNLAYDLEPLPEPSTTTTPEPSGTSTSESSATSTTTEPTTTTSEPTTTTTEPTTTTTAEPTTTTSEPSTTPTNSTGNSTETPASGPEPTAGGDTPVVVTIYGYEAVPSGSTTVQWMFQLPNYETRIACRS